MRKLILCLCLSMLGIIGTASAAPLSNIKYILRYNSTTCRYDLRMYLETGDILAGANQLASTNQLTIVVPTGTIVGGNSGINPVTVVSNEPKIGSITAGVVTRSSTPATWANTNKTTNPTSLAGSDIYAFVVPPSSAFWPTAVQGDTLTLFSITISTTTCGAGVRMWNNNVIQGTAVAGGDPTSAAAGMGGQDYNNGMNVHVPATVQVYNGNGIPNSMPSPTVSASSASFCVPLPIHANLAAVATPGACATATLTYLWTGPGAFTNTNASFTLTPIVTGVYTVTVTNSNGCTASSPTTVTLCPLALQLLNFGATANKCIASLKWELNDASQVERFDVQYSNDGSQFVTVGQVARNNNNESKYSFGYQQQDRKGYYRLKMVDVSGQDVYSQTVIAVTDCNTQNVTISPNPTTGNIFIKGVAAGDEIKVVDMIGQVVAKTISAGDAATMDLSRYAAGVYAVFVTHGETVTKVGQVVRQ